MAVQIKPSNKAFVALVAVAVVLFLICGFAYSNRSVRLQTLQTELRSKEEKLENSEQIASRLSTVEEEYLDAQATLSALEQGVSTKAYVPTLLRQLEELGTSVNLRVAGVRPRQPAPEARPVPTNTTGGDQKNQAQTVKKPEPYDKLEVEIELTGKYKNMVQFLYKITSFPKIVAVKDLQLSPDGMMIPDLVVGSPTLKAKLNTTAFILKGPAATGKKPDTRRQVSSGGRQI